MIFSRRCQFLRLDEMPPDNCSRSVITSYSIHYTKLYERDFNAAAFWAGITGFVWYAFGTVPLHIAVSGALGLSTAQSSSWMFIVWFSGAVASIALSLRFRQPIPITWTIPGLVYLGTLGA